MRLSVLVFPTGQTRDTRVRSVDPATGIVTQELWYRHGRSHRDDGPAVIRRDALTGTVILESWWRDGKLHRDDGPAFVVRDPNTGVPTQEEWYREGRATVEGAYRSPASAPGPTLQTPSV